MTTRPSLFDQMRILVRLPYWLTFDRAGLASPKLFIRRAKDLRGLCLLGESLYVDAEPIIRTKKYSNYPSWASYTAVCERSIREHAAWQPEEGEEVRRSCDWEHEFDFIVVDPDGWRVDGKSMDEPITRAEYEARSMMSTIMPRQVERSIAQKCSECERETRMEDDFGRVCGAQLDVQRFCEGEFR